VNFISNVLMFPDDKYFFLYLLIEFLYDRNRGKGIYINTVNNFRNIKRYTSADFIQEDQQ